MTSRGMCALALCGVAVLVACGSPNPAGGGAVPEPASSAVHATTAQSQPIATQPVSTQLPSIQAFTEHPTDQFLVDLDVVKGGHPFKGLRAATPHTGAHVLFGDDYLTWPKGGTAPTNYPPIYAVADGVVDHVDESMHVGDFDRYGIMLTVAQDGDTKWDFEYSIEPMVPEPSKGFYATFITVHNGDHVHKGDVIAYMYTPPKANGTHIHFELMAGMGGHFTAPAIFTPNLVKAFHERWGGFGLDGNNGTGTPMPVCMGWKLAAEENPFGTGAVDCL